jgi:isoleucyl-tRNA synthetase
VGNPWLDAGIVPFSTLKYRTDRDYWRQWFPADFVTESFPGQFRNWFYSLLAMSAFLEHEPPFKTLLGHALVKDETGRDMHKSWGNTIWFDDAAEKMGVDVMRWMYAAQNPEHNLLFGYHTGNEVRKKMIQFWNSYSFFATYAAVDGYDPGQSTLKESALTLMDRWILSKLNVFVRDSQAALEAFRTDQVMKKFERFLEDLSNWYIRRNRRRFWKSEDDLDKQTAYDTLFEVLTTTIKVLAPILPFVTEEMYQNLVGNTELKALESVHLCDFPAVNEKWIDVPLMEEVDTLRKVVELGRSARNKAQLKIRQPLAKLYFVIKDDAIARFILDQQSVLQDELNVKAVERVPRAEALLSYRIKPNLAVLGRKYGQHLPAIREFLGTQNGNDILTQLQSGQELTLEVDHQTLSLGWEDLLVETESTAGITASAEGNLVVGFSTELTEDLIKEGIVRDVIRQVQIMRKNANFAVEDRINIYGKVDGLVGASIDAFEEIFKNETLAINFLKEDQPGEYQASFTIGDQKITFGIERVTH